MFRKRVKFGSGKIEKMKKQFLVSIIITLLFSHFSLSGFSQNWLPLNVQQRSNFSFGDSIISYTAWVDSTKIIDSDSVYYLNRTIIRCENCTLPFCVSAIYLNAQPSLLTSLFFIKSDTIHFINSNKNYHYTLNLKSLAGVSFVFDSTNNITAKLFQSTDSLFWNSFDSVKIYMLSNSDTIILSKNHGLLKFPTFDSHKHITLIGVEGVDEGILTPKFSDFFSFNLGDKFEYRTEAGIRWVDLDLIEQITINSNLSQGDTISYGITKKTIRYIWLYNNIYDTVYTYINDTLTFIKQDYLYLDKYVGESLNYQQCGLTHKPIYLTKTNSFNCISKTFDYDQFIDISSDTIHETGCPSDITGCLSRYYNTTYGVNVGFIHMDSSEITMQVYDKYRYKNLTAAEIKGITYGVFTPDSLFLSEVPDSNNASIKLTVFPNPVTNYLTVETPQKSEIQILNIEGQIIKSFVDAEKHITIDVSDFAKGLYFIKVKTENGVAVEKFVKE
jgi:hypothetical protein